MLAELCVALFEPIFAEVGHWKSPIAVWRSATNVEHASQASTGKRHCDLFLKVSVIPDSAVITPKKFSAVVRQFKANPATEAKARQSQPPGRWRENHCAAVIAEPLSLLPKLVNQS
jgi:hypothetical protein